MLRKLSSNFVLKEIAELLTIMIATRFLDSNVGNNRFQLIFGSIDHNSMIVTYRVFQGSWAF